MSQPTAVNLISSVGRTRVLELSDGTVVERTGGTVSWRNNNPGNLKFAFRGSADGTDHVSRSYDRALHQARERYQGIIALDQYGNAVFSSLEAGRAAQLQHLLSAHRSHTVERMVLGYSTADYSGATHHSQQAAMIHRTAKERGCNLRGKAIGEMSADELDALAVGINRFEGFRVGETVIVRDALRQVATSPTQPRPPAHASEAADHASPPSALRHPAASASGRANMPAAGVHDLEGNNVGTGVLSLQHSLNQVGARDQRGLPLAEDGVMGRHTREAIKGFQRDHGLPEVGHMGPRTREALHASHGPRLSDHHHPDYPLFEKTLGLVAAAEARRGIAMGAHTENIAAALVVQMRREGMPGIDRVDLGEPPRFVRAVHVPPGASAQGEYASMPIETRTASRQSLHASSDLLAQRASPPMADAALAQGVVPVPSKPLAHSVLR